MSLAALLQAILPDAKTEHVVLPDVPELQLELLEDQCFRRPLTELEVNAAWENPPYWAFCWASGQAMARYILDNPSHFAGKSVIDFGCGSGIVGVAAAKVGAKVYACDIDPHALEAVKANTQINGVEVVSRTPEAGEIALFDSLASTPASDILVAADVLYDPANLPMLDLFKEAASVIWVADSRVRDFSHPSYRREAMIESVTLPDLDELKLYRKVSLYHST